MKIKLKELEGLKEKYLMANELDKYNDICIAIKNLSDEIKKKDVGKLKVLPLSYLGL